MLITSDQDREINRKIGRLFRAVRKQCNIRQDELAPQLGTTQGSLSKIENGLAILAAVQWVRFCEITGIPEDSLRTGLVDRQTPAMLSAVEHGTFRLPMKYARDAGSKVRSVLPFLMYFESLHGHELLDEYLKSQRVDPDYFLILDNPISLRFILDLTEKLVSDGQLKPQHFAALAQPAGTSLPHGRLAREYSLSRTADALLRTLVGHASFYECNFQYSIENTGAQSFALGVTPNPHVLDLKRRHAQTLANLCRYREKYFAGFSGYGGIVPVTVTERQCYFQGASKCVFETRLAS